MPTLYTITGRLLLPDGSTADTGKLTVSMLGGWSVDAPDVRVNQQTYSVLQDGTVDQLATTGLPAGTYDAYYRSSNGGTRLHFSFTLAANVSWSDLIMGPGVVIPSDDAVAQARTYRDEAQAAAAAAEAVGDTDDTIIAGRVLDGTSATTAALKGAYGALSMDYDASAPIGGNQSYMDLTHDKTSGYLIHLKSGPTMGAPAALIGVGVGDGGPTDAYGILISQKATSAGPAVKFTNAGGTTGRGIWATQLSTQPSAPLVYLEQSASAATDVLRLVTNGIPVVGQALALFQVGAIPGRAGKIMADSCDLVWQAQVRAQGSRLIAEEQAGVPDSSKAQVHVAGAHGYYPSIRDGVTTSGSTTLTSASAAFTAADNGVAITGPGIPSGTTITYVDAATVTLSAAATQTATAVPFTLARPGAANVPRVSLYRFSGAAGKHFSWRLGMSAPGGSATALEFAAANGASAPGVEIPTIRALTLDYAGGNPKVGLYSAAPVIQAARRGQLVDSSGGTSGGNAIAAVTDLPSAANAVATLAAKINALEAVLSAAAGGIGVTA